MAIFKPKNRNVSFDIKERVIGLAGIITAETAGWFAKFLCRTHAVNEDWDKPIIVFIDSNGGDAIASLQIYSMLRVSVLPIITVVIGRAYSGAFIISQAGKIRQIVSGGKMGFHSSCFLIEKDDQCNGKELARLADKCFRIDESECDILAPRTKLGRKKFKEFLDEDKVLTAKEAKKYNLADEIIKIPGASVILRWAETFRKKADSK